MFVPMAVSEFVAWSIISLFALHLHSVYSFEPSVLSLMYSTLALVELALALSRSGLVWIVI
jgi:hypothetical protein